MIFKEVIREGQTVGRDNGLSKFGGTVSTYCLGNHMRMIKVDGGLCWS